MKRVFRKAMLLALVTAIPGIARAGWVSEWTNIATKPNGDQADAQPSSMKISGGRVRLEQPQVVSLIDYNAGNFTLMNPVTQSFWSGTIDEYVRESMRTRAEGLNKHLAEAGEKARVPDDKDLEPPKIDPASLPTITITKTVVTDQIAGYDTEKYEVHADGDLFQEIWIAPTLNVSGDLNIDRYLDLQRKLNAAMAGKSAGPYNALYRSDEYRKLLEKAFVLKMITHHIAGAFQRTATSMHQGDVAPSQFEVPAEYRRVRLADVLKSPPKGS